MGRDQLFYSNCSLFVVNYAKPPRGQQWVGYELSPCCLLWQFLGEIPYRGGFHQDMFSIPSAHQRLDFQQAKFMEITLFRKVEEKERFLFYFISTTPTHNFCRECLSSEFRMLTLKAGTNSHVRDDDNYFGKHHFQSTVFLRLSKLLSLRSWHSDEGLVDILKYSYSFTNT